MSSIDRPLPSEASSIVLTLRMIMMGKEVGSIIGKNGDIIKAMREESDAKIYISDGSVPERIVTIIGHAEAVLKAFDLISKKLESDGHYNSSRDSKSIDVKLIVPASQCGSIIGKGGSKIKEMREVTGASIQLASEMLPNSTERLVTMIGSQESVSQVMYHICCIMLESPAKSGTVPYKPKGEMMGGGLLGFDRSLGGSNNPLVGLMALGGGTSNSNNALTALSQLLGGSSGSRRGDRDSYDDSYEMSVSNDLVGCVIGKGGNKIAQIRQLSGANIRISKNEDSDNSSGERSVYISGSSDSVSLAKSLINMTLDNFRNDDDDRGKDVDMRDRGDRGRGRSRNSSSSLGGGGGLASLLNKPDAVQALATLANLSTALGNFGDAFGSGLLPGSGMQSSHRSSRSSYGSSRRDDDRRESKRSKFAPY